MALFNPVDLSGLQKKTNIYRYAPTAGATITIPDSIGDIVVVIAPTTDLATLTISWPPTPYDGQAVRILCTKNITAVTHAGGNINRSVSSIPATGDINFIYDFAGVTYMSDGVTLSSVISLPFTASVAGGAGDVIFYPTDTSLVGGNALFATIQYIAPLLDVADPNYSFAKPVVSNSNKTVTINCKKQTYNVITLLSTNLLGSVTLGVAPNGTALSFLVSGTLA